MNFEITGGKQASMPAPSFDITFTSGFGLILSSGAFGYFTASCTQNGCGKTCRLWCLAPWEEQQVWIMDELEESRTADLHGVGYVAPIGLSASLHEQAIADLLFPEEEHTFQVDESISSTGWTVCAARHDEDFSLYRPVVCDGRLVGQTPRHEIWLRVLPEASTHGVTAVFTACLRPSWEVRLDKSTYPLAALVGTMAGFFTGQIVDWVLSMLGRSIG